MRTGKALLGIIAGFASGVALGVLFAPNKGSRTRKKIARRRHYLADEVSNKYDDIVSNISEKMDDAEQRAEALLKKGKNMINKV